MQKEKRNIIIILILFIISLQIGLMTAMGLVTGRERSSEIVPLSGMPYSLHVFVFWIIWPTLLSIVFAIVFPLIINPLFMMIKRIVWSRYKDCYVDMREPTLDLRTFFKRGIYISLLIIGIIITIVSSVDTSLFLTEYNITNTMYSENILFEPDVLTGLAYLILPFAVGLWAVGWSIKDAGLMHYRFPKEIEESLFEIEPVHLKYNGLIKGYTGVSSMIFIITAIIVYLPVYPWHILSVVIPLVLYMMTNAGLSYLVYFKINQSIFRKKLRKGLQKLEMLSEKDLKLV